MTTQILFWFQFYKDTLNTSSENGESAKTNGEDVEMTEGEKHCVTI